MRSNLYSPSAPYNRTSVMGAYGPQTPCAAPSAAIRPQRHKMWRTNKCGEQRGMRQRLTGVVDIWSPDNFTNTWRSHLLVSTRPPGDQPRLPPEQQHHPGAAPIRSTSSRHNTTDLAPCATPPHPDRPPLLPSSRGLAIRLKPRSQRSPGEKFHQGRAPWQPNTAPTSIIPPRLSCQAFTRHAGA